MLIAEGLVPPQEILAIIRDETEAAIVPGAIPDRGRPARRPLRSWVQRALAGTLAFPGGNA